MKEIKKNVKAAHFDSNILGLTHFVTFTAKLNSYFRKIPVIW